MIREISLSNIRVFETNRWTFEISPLTIFCGTNSAGKSTVLKTLLLLQQTMGASGEYLRKSGYLKFSGRSVDLGDYDTLVSRNQQEKPIRIGLVTTGSFPHSSAAWIYRDLEQFIPKTKMKQVRGSSYELSIDLSFVHSSVIEASSLSATGEPPASDTDPIEPFISPEFGHGLLESARYSLRFADEMFRWDISINTTQRTKRSPRYKISVLRSLVHNFFGTRDETPITDGSGYGTFDVDLDGILPSSITVSRDDVKGIQPPTPLTSFRVPLPSVIEFATDRLRNDLQNIHYLGPLRSPGRRFYVLNPDYFSEFDAAGEFLPYILRDRRNERIVYCSPSALFLPKEGTLERALNEWLYYLKHGTPSNEKSDPGGRRLAEFESEFQKQVLGELRLKGMSTTTHALVDTGFGYSQVLPVLVRGLLTPSGGMFIVEQPELHLHPALQSRLGAFFISMTYSNRTVVLESHSEHLVNALRASAAENPKSGLSERIKVHFIDGGSDGPNVHDLSVREDGTIPSMPRSFFGEGISLSGRLLRAQRHHLKRPQDD